MRIERVWAMPNPATFTIKPIRELLVRYVTKPEGWIDPFAGLNSPAFHSNDLNPECPTRYHLDAVEFLEHLHDYDETGMARFEGALLDPPYTLHQSNQVYKGYGLRKPISLVKDLIAPLIKSGGLIICFGHNSNGMGINRGFEMVELLLVPHGGSHDDTLVTVERKIR